MQFSLRLMPRLRDFEYTAFFARKSFVDLSLFETSQIIPLNIDAQG